MWIVTTVTLTEFGTRKRLFAGWTRREILRLAGALLTGFLLFSAFPPMAGAEAAWVALVPLLLLARYSPPRLAWNWGLVAGLAFWLPSLAWLLRLRETGGVPWPVIGLGWAALAAYCALYVAAFAFTASVIFRRRWGGAAAPRGWWTRLAGNVGVLVVLPLTWAGLEWLRGVIITGFPWNYLGASQYANLSVIQCAAWGGTYAVSAVLALMNVAVALTAERYVASCRREYASRLHAELLIALAACSIVWITGAKRALRLDAPAPGSTPIRVAAVQPNVAQLAKWTPDDLLSIFDTLRKYTELAALVGPDLIVWPETCVPGPVNTDETTRRFLEQAPRGTVPLLVGGLEEFVEGGRPYYFNSSVLYAGADGEIAARYRKQHLVLFGEYLPLERQFPALSALSPLGWTCRAGDSNVVFTLPIRREGGHATPAAAPQPAAPPVPAARFSALICFEDIMPELSRRAVREGARFLVNQTNDAWFDGTAGPWQHLANSVLRAVENRVPLVRSANTGVTGLVTANGRTKLLQGDGRLTGFEGFSPFGLRVEGPEMALTFYTRHGDWCFGIPAAALAVALLAWGWWDERRSKRA
jgi:apolipoprotein N-acyltransferase